MNNQITFTIINPVWTSAQQAETDRKISVERIQLPTPGGVLDKVLYGEVPPRGPTVLYIILTDGGPLSHTVLMKKTLFPIYLRTLHPDKYLEMILLRID